MWVAYGAGAPTRRVGPGKEWSEWTRGCGSKKAEAIRHDFYGGVPFLCRVYDSNINRIPGYPLDTVGAHDEINLYPYCPVRR